MHNWNEETFYEFEGNEGQDEELVSDETLVQYFDEIFGTEENTKDQKNEKEQATTEENDDQNDQLYELTNHEKQIIEASKIIFETNTKAIPATNNQHRSISTTTNSTTIISTTTKQPIQTILTLEK
ncbi:hypothetical protein M0813_06070 [Anaeramoeba flamelloides]|uniref:Uncharacterized protein n=1 Tax=Anaeramoeba flamelloides TaxID=1746091 RepID=A0ABQ8XFB5_9EUKA|nr:hypothetical protein M0813_06070 [Anaeramoeba flamelloides]